MCINGIFVVVTRPTFSSAESTSALMHHAGHKFQEVFQMKHGGYSDLPAAKISELMKSNSLDVITLIICFVPPEYLSLYSSYITQYGEILFVQIAPTQSLLSMVNGILDESISRKNGEIPHV